MTTIRVQSELVGPGERKAFFVLLKTDPSLDLEPSRVDLDVATYAAFGMPERLDVLTAGETLEATGQTVPSLRLVIKNRHGSEPARFVANVVLLPNLSKMENHLGNIVDDAWRKGRDALKAAG